MTEGRGNRERRIEEWKRKRTKERVGGVWENSVEECEGRMKGSERRMKVER